MVGVIGSRKKGGDRPRSLPIAYVMSFLSGRAQNSGVFSMGFSPEIDWQNAPPELREFWRRAFEAVVLFGRGGDGFSFSAADCGRGKCLFGARRVGLTTTSCLEVCVPGVVYCAIPIC